MNMHILIPIQFGVTPLMTTIMEGHLDVFKSLIWNGRANLNLQEKVFMHATMYNVVNCIFFAESPT